MYVCICNNLNEEVLQKNIQGNEKTSDEVLEKLGHQHDCGSCSCDIKQMIKDKADKKARK